ncbi:MAG: SLC13 family permease [Cellulosilyticaceae bacterium]
MNIKDAKGLMVWLKKECVMLIAVGLAIVSSLVAVPKWEYIDMKVLVLLFNLMVIVVALREEKVLDYVAIGLLKKCHTQKGVYGLLIGITFVVAMIVTNDVALITFVPLAIIIGQKAGISVLKLVVLQTIAANLGSSLTPMGNPQNLFVYSYYELTPWAFFRVTIPLAICGGLFLIVIILFEKNKRLILELDNITIKQPQKVVILGVLLGIVLLSVFHLIHYGVAAIIVIISIACYDRTYFKKVDYSLLITFVGFFVFVGNLSHLQVVKGFMEGLLDQPLATYIASILGSQVISNVPAAMLMSGFTQDYAALLLGVNIGGLGTLIASLASVIAYKLYVEAYPKESSSYIKCFTVYNILGLMLLGIVLGMGWLVF